MTLVSFKELAQAIYGYLRGRSTAGRNVIVLPDDTFLVSFARSGNTWARFLIGNLLCPQGVTFANIERVIPDIYACTQKAVLKVPRPRIVKSHEPFEPRYRKVIYLVRDPRDVAVSLYYWEMKRRHLPEGYPLRDFVRRFIAGDVVRDSGSWSQNVGSWLVARAKTADFLWLRYEDMLDDPARELTRIAAFLGGEKTPEQIVRAVELSSAERMRDLEKQQSEIWHTTRSTHRGILFVRSARRGNWKFELPPESAAEIEAAWGVLMRILGYEPDYVRPDETPDPLSELLAQPQTSL
jgi:hypothetical protein